MTESVDVEEFRQGFLGEADEHLGRITSNLAAIERAPERSHARELAELLRSLHTLKGLAGMMGVDPIVELAHRMEALVRDVQRSGGRLAASLLDPLVAGTQAISQRVRSVAESEPVAPVPEALLSQLELGTQAAPSASRESDRFEGIDPELTAALTASERDDLRQAIEEREPIFRIVFQPTPAKSDAGIGITTVRSAVARHGRVVRVLPRAVPRSEEAPGGLEFVLLVVSTMPPELLAAVPGIDVAERVLVGEVRPAAATDPDDDAFDRGRRGVVRMHVAKLDVALEHLGALSVARVRMRDELARLAAAGQDVRALRTLIEDDARELRRLRATLLSLRMVPLREVLEPVPLIVRGMRNSTGKHVQLAVDVGDVELDKTVGERLLPALVHLVRNAVDHGIEDAATRRARGKPEVGVVELSAVAAAGALLEICVADDGAGIDAEAVARRADAALPATDAELLDLLTAPGFSTRETATMTSGRGIGLDVVRQIMEGLGGSLELESRPGQGARFRLHAPLTVAVLDAFAFEAGGERYLAPIAAVDAIVEIDPADVAHPPGRATAADRPVEMVDVRGHVMPLVSLRDALGLPRGGDEPKAMIVRRAGQRFALSIARMLGRHEVLVRPLVDPLVRVRAVSGSADLGDGRPTLVIDLQRLTHELSAARTEEARS
jgi:two-component system chemotaxis sensor kinase CheA